MPAAVFLTVGTRSIEPSAKALDQIARRVSELREFRRSPAPPSWRRSRGRGSPNWVPGFLLPSRVGIWRRARELVLAPVESAEAPTQDHEVVFLQNFSDELRRRVPVGK